QDRLLAGAGLVDDPALVLERQLDRAADALVVLHVQDPCTHGAIVAHAGGVGAPANCAWPQTRSAPSSRSSSRMGSNRSGCVARTAAGRTGPPSSDPSRARASRAMSAPAARSHTDRPAS